MAAAAVLNAMTIPGLHVPPSLDNLEKSRLAYNALPDDCDQPNVTDTILAELKDLLETYNVQEKFGYHLVHGHLQVNPGRVMLGQPMTNLDACWTRPTSVEEVGLGDVHGHIFVLGTDGQFMPYEYRQGSPPEMTANDDAFLLAVQKYLAQKNLASLIGIQLLMGASFKKMNEFVLSDKYGTVMMDANNTNVTKTYRVTGWVLERTKDGITQLKGNDVHAPTNKKGGHQVWIDTKLDALPDVGGGVDADVDIDEKAVIDALRREGVVN